MSTRRESGCLMYQIAYIGRWETLPETAAAICDHDTPKLEALLQGGLDLGAPIQLSEYIKLKNGIFIFFLYKQCKSSIWGT